MAQSPIKHVFVLMLENHSFDNIFAMSGIPNIHAATPQDCNVYKGTSYCVGNQAPSSMSTDPGHEFLDVLHQLAGRDQLLPGDVYPPVTNVGYVSNYAVSTDEKTGQPTCKHYGDVMQCFDTPAQLPVIYQLATQFALCDNWYSAMPGPTWPNRFFVHGASSAGLDDSPSTEDILLWEGPQGFKYPNGSVYDVLKKQKSSYRLYIDEQSASGGITPPGGNIPQVAALKGISILDVHWLSGLKKDLHKHYPHLYTFIEPNYGNVLDNTYENGSCQHPMDGMYGGEKLIKYVYDTIRNSPLWDDSLLIITYDEHGGFYDSAKPGSVIPPGDGSPKTYNRHDFKFDQLGVRVPAVIVSPRIKAGTVDSRQYDHSSVLATLRQLLPQNHPRPRLPLTQRDAAANDLLHLVGDAVRTDCPQYLTEPAVWAWSAEKRLAEGERLLEEAEKQAILTDEQTPAAQKGLLALSELAQLRGELRQKQATKEAGRSQRVPSRGNTQGFLQILYKADLEMARTSRERAQAKEDFGSVHTVEDAHNYVRAVQQKIEQRRAES